MKAFIPVAENPVVFFGPFRLTLAARSLECDGRAVKLGSRALNILIALVERSAEIVSQQELIRQAWPDRVVDDGSLRVTMAALRKALRDGENDARYIVNVPGRGYAFVAPTRHQDFIPKPTVATTVSDSPHNLRPMITRMVGRKATIQAICENLRAERFVSLVGTGGIGKTTVAVAVAHALLNEFADGIVFVDLSVISDTGLVPAAIACAVGCVTQGPDQLKDLACSIADTKRLLILDSCEHVLEAVAELAEHIFSQAPSVHLLITSREALRIDGESVYLLSPLECPREGGDATAVEVLDYPATRLFMSRAAASGYRFELTDVDAPTVAQMCRRLDGIALAIELAASQVGRYGIQGTAAILDSRLSLLWRGHRNSPPRHQTLQALLDWSLNLLSEREQRVLICLSVFVGCFTFEAAMALLGEPEDQNARVAEAIMALVEKSLLSISVVDGSNWYRLLDTTKAYAATKLAECGKRDDISSRHALYFSNVLMDEVNSANRLVELKSTFSQNIDNVRAALEWSLCGAGDHEVGIKLCFYSAPQFLKLSLLVECQRWCQCALRKLDGANIDAEWELALLEVMAISSHFAHGDSAQVRAAIERGLDLAEARHDLLRQLRMLSGLNLSLSKLANLKEALVVAGRYAALSENANDPEHVISAKWMLGTAHHLIGDQSAAQGFYESGFGIADAFGAVKVCHFGYDHKVHALAGFARTLWLRAMSEGAFSNALMALDHAEAGNEPITICVSLIDSIPMFLWSEQYERAEILIDRLISHAAKYSLGPQEAAGVALRGATAVARGDAVNGLRLLRTARVTLQAAEFTMVLKASSRALAEGLAQRGLHLEAMEAIDSAIALSEQFGGTFDMPDLWRAKGELLLSLPRPDVETAEKALLRSIQCARRQSALFWELRAVIPLARLWVHRGRSESALAMIGDVLRRVPVGSDMSIIGTAKHLLKEVNGNVHGSLP